MIHVNTHQAKSRLSALLSDVEQKGETVVICRNGKPVAELHRYEVPRRPIMVVHEKLKPIYMEPGFDPVQPLSPEDWPEEQR